MNRDEIFSLIVQSCCEVLPELKDHQFIDSDRLVELGANSIDRADITMIVMDALSLQIPRIELSGVKNIGELADVLYTKSKNN